MSFVLLQLTWMYFMKLYNLIWRLGAALSGAAIVEIFADVEIVYATHRLSLCLGHHRRDEVVPDGDRK